MVTAARLRSPARRRGGSAVVPAVHALCRNIAATLVFTLASATAATAKVERAGVELPATVAVGGQSLALASCGVRDTFWIDHYVAALYLLPGAPVVAAMRDVAQPKTIMMHIVRGASLPEQIPKQWREPMREELRSDPLARIRAAYSSLSTGDRVWVTYTRSAGLTIAVNGREVARAPNQDLIEAMLRTWADGDPISGKLERLLLESPC